MDYRKGIIILLQDEGIALSHQDNDVDLREYITNSIQFISFIVDIEEKFEITMPDEYLSYESLSSLYAFAGIVEDLCLNSAY